MLSVEVLIADLFKTLLPVAAVLYGVLLLVRSFFNKQLIENKQVLLAENQKITLPIQLQSYERLCLLLERLEPSALMLRTLPGATSALEFQSLLVQDIRQEFQHNAAQQLYVSTDVWENIRLYTQELTTLINKAAANTTPESSPMELARKIGELTVTEPSSTHEKTLAALKKEAEAKFFSTEK